VRVVEAWEHTDAADYDFIQGRPNEKVLGDVARLFLDGKGWALHSDLPVAGSLSSPVPQFFWLWPQEAYAAADFHAARQRESYSAREGPLDELALADVQRQFGMLEQLGDPKVRGEAFDDFVRSLLQAHGCTVEIGKRRPGEQVDVLMVEPDVAVIECRWRVDSTDSAAIRTLYGKLGSRPPTVSGLYFSMSGFTSEVQDVVDELSTSRTIIMVGPHDIKELIGGSIRFLGYLRKRKLELLRRYPVRKER